jgi:hypothetical protein
MKVKTDIIILITAIGLAMICSITVAIYLHIIASPITVIRAIMSVFTFITVAIYLHIIASPITVIRATMSVFTRQTLSFLSVIGLARYVDI